MKQLLVVVLLLVFVGVAVAQFEFFNTYFVSSGVTDGYVVFPKNAPYDEFRVSVPDNDVLVRWSRRNVTGFSDWITLRASGTPYEFTVPRADSLEYDRTAPTIINVWAGTERQ